MSSTPDERSIVDAERRILQALCQEMPEESFRETARRLLSEYRWQDPIHRVVFDCVINFPADSSLAIRDQLPAHATRKGFPDVSWENFFHPLSISKQEAEDLIRRLHDSGGSGKKGE